MSLKICMLPVIFLGNYEFASAGSYSERWYCTSEDGCGTFDKYYNSKDWMRMISDDHKLHELSIPGTHDSMARHGLFKGDKGLIGTTWIICQSMELKTQLEKGIRAFDIRNWITFDIWTQKHKFDIYHGIVSQHATFGDDVVKVMSDFLDDNPTETIIMMQKQVHDQGWPFDSQDKAIQKLYEETMQVYKKKYTRLTELTKTQAASYTLGKARGKILINYVDQKSSKKYTDGWVDHWVYNTCSVRNTEWNNIVTNALEPCTTNTANKDTLYGSFLSGNSYENAVFNDGACDLTVGGIAKYMNDKLDKYLGKGGHGDSRIGIHFMDFPGPQLIARIIRRNPFTCGRYDGLIQNSKKVVVRCKKTEQKSAEDIRKEIDNMMKKRCAKKNRPRSWVAKIIWKAQCKNYH